MFFRGESHKRWMVIAMADTTSLKMKNGKLYEIRSEGGYHYVYKPGWLGKIGVGSARTFNKAVRIAEADADSTIREMT
jgi:hypothetical protein